MTKYDYIAIAVLIALMVWAVAERFPRDKWRLSASGGIDSFSARHSAWGGIVSFIALAIVGLFYVKWSPYYATALVAAQDRALGASIVTGNLPARQEPVSRPGLLISSPISRRSGKRYC